MFAIVAGEAVDVGITMFVISVSSLSEVKMVRLILSFHIHPDPIFHSLA